MTTRERAERMQAAAAAFLEALEPQQRAAAQWAFEDTAERQSWYYTPTDHGGLPLSAMNPLQQKRAHMLLAEGLSHSGYNTCAVIMGWENILDRLEGHIRDWGRERGRDPGLYYWRVFGDPGSGEPWSWRVGGHHISVSHVIVDGEVVGSTPLFMGADPAHASLGGADLVRPVGPVELKARELMLSLDDDQRALAIVTDTAPTDIVACNRPVYGRGDGDLPLPLQDVWRGRLPDPWHELATTVQQNADAQAGLEDHHLEAVRLTCEPKGIPASALHHDQRAALRELLDLYASRLPDGLREIEQRKFDGPRLDDHSLLWAGGVGHGIGYYYRVQGPHLMVECDNTQRGANHVHTVWRDPYRDFGVDPLAEHYQSQHPGRGRPGSG